MEVFICSRVRKFAALAALLFCQVVGLGADVSLKWDPSLDAGVVAYRLYYSAIPGVFLTRVEVAAPGTSTTVQGLSAGTLYYFAASAVGPGGVESELSIPISFLIPLSNRPPTALSLSVSTQEENQVAVRLQGSDPDGDTLRYVISRLPVNGSISGSGANLVYTPKPNFYGVDQFTYGVSDATSTTSAVVTINVAPVNDKPTLNSLPVIVLAQNAGPKTVPLSGIGSGASNESQTLTVSAGSTNPNVIPTPTVSYATPNTTGTLIFTPNANAIGWTTINVTVNDGGSINNSVTQNLSVFINNPPTLNPISNVTVNEDSSTTTVALTGISPGGANEPQAVSITAESSAPALIPNPIVNYVAGAATGSLTFKPAANAFGTATIKVTVSDGQYGNNTLTRTFVVTVNPINDKPTLGSISSLTIDSRSGTRTITLTGITTGATNEVQPLTVTAESSNASLIPTPVVSAISTSGTATLMLTPVINTEGVATITVKVNDGQTANNLGMRTFNVTVVTPPKISQLAATAMDAGTIRVTWLTDRAATGQVDYGRTTAYGQLSATTSGTSHSVTLTNLDEGSLYYLRIRATTGFSSTTATATTTTEPLQAIQWAAEGGQLGSGAVVYSSLGTENGKAISAAATGQSSAVFNVNLPTGPTYQLWARVQTAPGGGRFSLSTDGSVDKALFVGDNGATNAWHWARVTEDSNRTNAYSLSLQGGAHSLRILFGAGVRLDEFLLVNDQRWQPILPTTQPMLNVTRDSSSAATLTWSDPSQNATSVRIEYSTDGVNYAWLGVTIGAAETGTIRLINLGPMTYYYRLYSYNSVDRTAYSNVGAALY